MSQMKPDPSSLTTPPSEPWFSDSDLQIDAEATDIMSLLSSSGGGGGPGSRRTLQGNGAAFLETIEMQERVVEKLEEESGLLLRKANDAIENAKRK
jgi:hypothetical protein